MPGDREAGASSSTPSTGRTSAEILRDYPELLQRLPAIVYIADTGSAGRWHYVSPQIESILGFDAEEWRADPTLWAQRLQPEDRQRVLADEAEHAARGAQRSAVEYRMLDRDGHVVWMRDDAALVPVEDGSLRWHGVLSDVTERK